MQARALGTALSTIALLCYADARWLLIDEIACLCRDVFPSSRCLFMYRDVLAVAKSLYRVSMVMTSLRLAELLSCVSGHVIKTMLEYCNRRDVSDLCVRANNDLTVDVLIYAIVTSVYLDMRRRGYNISALRYEDLVARPLDMCRVILEFCHLPVSLAELAVKAFDVDSHRNSITAKSVLERFKEPRLTPEKKAKLNELLKKFEFPLIGEPNLLEGTIYCPY